MCHFFTFLYTQHREKLLTAEAKIQFLNLNRDRTGISWLWDTCSHAYVRTADKKRMKEWQIILRQFSFTKPTACTCKYIHITLIHVSVVDCHHHIATLTYLRSIYIIMPNPSVHILTRQRFIMILVF